jgi:glycerophosphoryl diester phosphodiesterase
MKALVSAALVGMAIVPALPGAEIIAHRGASYDAPENTLASVKLGWQQGDAVEIDIHLSADGQVVVIHDADTKRIGGRDRKVAEQTLKELRELDYGRWKSPEFAGEPIPTLDDVLATVPKGKRLFIEIKAGPEILPALQGALEKAKLPAEQTPLIGFDYETMRAARKQHPQLKVYWLVSLKKDPKAGQLNHTAAELVEKTKAAGLDGLDLGNTPPLTDEFVRTVREAGLELYVYTVNDPAKARDSARLGVDGITTDRPGWLKEHLASP